MNHLVGKLDFGTDILIEVLKHMFHIGFQNIGFPVFYIQIHTGHYIFKIVPVKPDVFLNFLQSFNISVLLGNHLLLGFFCFSLQNTLCNVMKQQAEEKQQKQSDDCHKLVIFLHDSGQKKRIMGGAGNKDSDSRGNPLLFFLFQAANDQK